MWHAVTLFIYFYINRADIQYFIYITRRVPLLLLLFITKSTVHRMLNWDLRNDYLITIESQKLFNIDGNTASGAGEGGKPWFIW